MGRGGTWNVEFRVVNIDGLPIPNVEVTFGDSVVPTLWGVPSPTFNGAGARVVGARTVRTNAAGHAGTTIEANGIAGSFELPVAAGSLAHRQLISTSPERPATVSVTSPTAVTVGEGQPVEILVQARDRFGNVTPDGQLVADWDDYWFDLSAADRLGTLHRLVLTTLPFEETPEELPSITTTVIVGVGDAAGIAGPAAVQVTILNT